LEDWDYIYAAIYLDEGVSPTHSAHLPKHPIRHLYSDFQLIDDL